jgi:hypothetical protein
LYVFNEKIKELPRSWTLIKSKPFLGLLLFLLDIIYTLLGAVIILFFIWFIFHFLKHLTGSQTLFESNFIRLIIYFQLWVLILIDLIQRVLSSENEMRKYLLPIVLAGALIGFVKINNSNKSEARLAGTYSYQIEFINEKEHVISSDSLIYVGKTENYIFLWDRAEEINRIYNMDDISQLKMGNIPPEVIPDSIKNSNLNSFGNGTLVEK